MSVFPPSNASTRPAERSSAGARATPVLYASRIDQHTEKVDAAPADPG